MSLPDDTRYAIAAWRLQHDSAPESADLALFGLLAREIQRVATLQSCEAAARVERDLALGVLDRLPFGVLIVDGYLRIRHETAGARRLLGAPDGLARDGDRLRAANARGDTALSELVAGTIEAAHRGEAATPCPK